MDNGLLVNKGCEATRLEYEFLISKLKRDAYLLQDIKQLRGAGTLTGELETLYQQEVEQLRALFYQAPELAGKVSSYYAVPTRELADSQRVIHRIWLGGTTPYEVNEAIDQWFCAINDSVPQNTSRFRQVLWVWEASQLKADSRFIAGRAEDPFKIGCLYTLQGTLQIHSLSALLESKAGAPGEFIQQLHQQGYYATLSDYFRLMILLEYGGIYMDADTLPYKPVSWFLSKPELPDLLHVAEEGKPAVRLSWLNLFLDETGMIIAAQGNPALQDIFLRLSKAYSSLPVKVPAKNIAWEREVFGLFYAIWQEHLARTFISHDRFCQQYAVFNRRTKEAVPCGIRGMRLLDDIISGERRPLSADEARSYQQAICNLKSRDWTLRNVLELGKYAEVYDQFEVPRIAYALQLRSDVEHYHYYSVLSDDEQLDRVNQLFGRYLLERNRVSIAAGGFWQVPGQQSASLSQQDITVKCTTPALLFVPGTESSSEEQNRMAKLIFSTSYLEYCSVGNPSGLDIVALQRAQNIEPWLEFLTVVHTTAGKFAGFFTAGLSRELDEQPVPSLYREEIAVHDRAYEAFVAENSQAEDYFICSLALEEAQRGKGYLRLMMQEIDYAAWLKGASRLTLCVWESSAATNRYLRQGFQHQATLESCLPWFGDRLLFLQRPLSQK